MAETGPSAPRTIRVGHILDGRHFGGAEQMVRRLAAASPRAGIDARVYCLSEGRLAAFLREAGVPCRVFPSAGRLDFRFLGAIARAAREDRLQILQAHTSRTHLVARLLSRRLGLPNITTIQSPIALDENRGHARHPLRASVERLGRRWTDAICPVSEEEAARLARDEGVPPGKLCWIPNGIEALADAAVESAARRAGLASFLAAEGLAPETFVAAMIAQMRPRKGPEVLLEAFATFMRAAPGPALLLMIGGDEFAGAGYLAQLQSRASSLDIAGHVRFTGFTPAPWALAAGADLFVLPSLFGEGMPLVALEAMNYGLPLALSAIQGHRELIVDAAGGWLHPPGNASALSVQLAEAAGDPALRQARGLAARRRFLARYTLDHVLAAHRALYERLTR